MNAPVKAKRTHIETMVEKDYLGAWDFADRDWTLEVEKVEKKTLNLSGGKKKTVPVLTFKGARKKFVLAARTNRDQIAALYGPYIEDWQGKALTLYCDPHCKSPEGRGKTVPGIRIRPVKPTTKGEALPEKPVDEDMKAAQDAGFGREPGQEG